MKLKLKCLLSPLLMIPLINSCGDAAQDSYRLSEAKDVKQISPDRAASNAEAPEHQIVRKHVVDVKFSKWVNLVRIDAGVTPVANEDKCEFVNPVANDMTTSWKPFQIYWVFKENHSGLSQTYSDIFAPGDRLHVSDLAKEGIRAVGFRELTKTNRKFFKISNVKLSIDKSRITGSLVIPSASITKNFAVDTMNIDGNCVVKTTSLNTRKAVNHYYVSQNIFGLVRSVSER